MELSSFQKDIIREIANGNVYDLLSFFSTFFKNKEYKHNYEYIKEKKKQDYENKKGNIEEYLKSITKTSMVYDTSTFSNGFVISNYPTEEKEELRKQISDYNVNYVDFQQTIKIKGIEFVINSLNEGVYLLDNKHNKILDFLYVWQLLQSEQLILTYEGEVNDKIAKIFFKKKSNKDNDFNTKSLKDIFENKLTGYSGLQKDKFQSILNDISQKNVIPLPFNKKIFYKSNDAEYSDTILIEDKEAIKVSQDYIDKKILVLPGLLRFIQDDFVSDGEKKYRKEHRLTIIAIFVSIFFSITSLATSFYFSLSDSKFWSHNESLRTKQYNQMNKLLIEVNNRLEETNNKLSNVKTGIGDGEIKVDEIKEDINKILELLRQF